MVSERETLFFAMKTKIIDTPVLKYLPNISYSYDIFSTFSFENDYFTKFYFIRNIEGEYFWDVVHSLLFDITCLILNLGDVRSIILVILKQKHKNIVPLKKKVQYLV